MISPLPKVDLVELVSPAISGVTEMMKCPAVPASWGTDNGVWPVGNDFVQLLAIGNESPIGARVRTRSRCPCLARSIRGRFLATTTCGWSHRDDREHENPFEGGRVRQRNLHRKTGKGAISTAGLTVVDVVGRGSHGVRHGPTAPMNAAQVVSAGGATDEDRAGLESQSTQLGITVRRSW